MFCTKFTPSADRIQLLKVITGPGLTIRHWHKLFLEVYVCLFVCLTTHGPLKFICIRQY